MRVDGRCHCGQINYQAEVDPDSVTICHCTDCQNLTGTAFRVSVQALRDQFILLSGQPKTYDKKAEDGSISVQGFCPNCASLLYSAHAGGSTYGLRVGCLEQRQGLVPRRQIWCRSALPWAINIEDVPRLEKD